MNVARFERDGDLGAIVLCSPPRRLAGGPTRGYAAIKSLVKAHAGGVAVADTLLADLTMGLYETADARNAIPHLATALAADKPLPDIKWLGR